MKSVSLGLLLLAGAAASAQAQTRYSGVDVTGEVVLTGTVNALDQAGVVSSLRTLEPGPELTHTLRHPAPRSPVPAVNVPPPIVHGMDAAARQPDNVQAVIQGPEGRETTPYEFARVPDLASSPSGFRGLTHLEQREANGGNQYNIEPPDQGLAVAHGFVVEAVNNAFQVFDTSGRALLPQAIALNQLFGLPPAVDRATQVIGPFPKDPKVHYDPDTQRWFVTAWTPLVDQWGNTLNESRIYIAVSQTMDPTGSYNVYAARTTESRMVGCPCKADFPQVGADRNGFYISTNEYSFLADSFVHATISAISKAALAAGSRTPTAVRFTLPFRTGFEFTVQPAVTPPGASYFAANGGLQYFISSNASAFASNTLAVWAVSNTRSLDTRSPSLTLTQTFINTQVYGTPPIASQRPGPLPYGSSLRPKGLLPQIDAGDARTLAVVYAGGRLYATLGTRVVDASGAQLAAAAYFILSPTFREQVLQAPVLRQGYVSVRRNHVLMPAIAVTAAGRGAMAFSVVGPDYFPSAAYVPIDTFSTGSTVQIAARGAAPEDGFTGYPPGGVQGIARWGDYSAVVVSTDGSIWMGMEYVPPSPRTELANWGTYLMRYVP